jgi:two-component system LytT family response regulator
VVVVDDEAPARRKVLRFLKDHADASVVGEAATGHEAIEVIRSTSPDLVFLDVQLPDMDGFDVLRELEGNPMPRIVFATAYDQYAIQAFDVHAFGYLLKPFDRQRFDKVLHDAKQHMGERDAEAEQIRRLLGEFERRRQGPGRLLVEQGERAFFLSPGDIDWIESDRNYVVLHSREQSYTVRTTMDALEQKLDKDTFVRLNRSALVRVDFIKELQKWFHGEYKVILKNGGTLTWTRRYLDRHSELLQRL